MTIEVSDELAEVLSEAGKKGSLAGISWRDTLFESLGREVLQEFIDDNPGSVEVASLIAAIVDVTGNIPNNLQFVPEVLLESSGWSKTVNQTS